jgi:hypothetical protein
MNRVIVTPAGRSRYLKILYKYLIKYKNEFNEWHLWANTDNKEDLNYINELFEQNDWIKVIPLNSIYEGSYSIHSFYPTDSCNPNNVYLRLDDDIIFIKENSINNIFEYRLKNRNPFLVFGNIVNNGICNHIHKRIGAVFSEKNLDYNCMGDSWYNPSISIDIHREFINNLFSKNLNKYLFSEWNLYNYERFSINVMSWLGSDFNSFNGNVGRDEEQWLSVDKPASIKRCNTIYGNSLFVHYSFYTQKGTLDETEILKIYETLAEEI